MGCVALGLLLVAEFTLVLWLRGLSISDYLASRDPVSGTVYYVMLGVFAIMPLLVARTGDRDIEIRVSELWEGFNFHAEKGCLSTRLRVTNTLSAEH